jgi:hypothetical protein
MKWNMWRKEKEAGIDGAVLPKPKELHQRVGIYLITQLRLDPDYAWTLMQANSPVADSRHLVNFRIYDPLEAQNRGVTVRDYRSLDNHPELVLYSGSLNKKAGAVTMTAQPVAA